MNIIGIDVSKAKLDCAWLKEDNKVKTKVFTNQLEGWKGLVSWAKTQTGNELSELHFVMEATGTLMKTWRRGCMIVVRTCLSPILPTLTITPKV